MDSLPVETLQQIFEHACTDGGSTGNALSLTSKQIRAAARRARFHTLRVAADSDAFPEFIAFFEHECNSGQIDRPRVRHLHLTLASVPFIPPNIAQTTRTLQNPQTYPASRELEPGRIPDSLATPLEGSDPDLPYCRPRAVEELFRFVAPDLRSLVVYSAPHGLPRDLRYPILKYTFPLLREAAFIGFPGPADLLSCDWDTKLPPVLFPRATHLYLSPRIYEPELHLSAWSVLAPRVTHLHVSGALKLIHVYQLAEAVGVHVQVTRSPLRRVPALPNSLPPPPLPSPPTYPSVRYLLMEPAEKPHGRTCGNFLRGQMAIWNGLSDIVRECHRRVDNNVKATLLKMPDTVSYEQHAKVLSDQWVERVEGGEGWWKGVELD